MHVQVLWDRMEPQLGSSSQSKVHPVPNATQKTLKRSSPAVSYSDGFHMSLESPKPTAVGEELRPDEGLRLAACRGNRGGFTQ